MKGFLKKESLIIPYISGGINVEENRLREIEIVAKNCGKGNLPQNMSMAESLYYKNMRAVYSQFYNKAISKEDAKMQKRSALDDYENFAMWERIFQNHIKINTELEKLIQPASQLKHKSKEQLLEIVKKFQFVLAGFFEKSEKKEDTSCSQ